MPGYCRAMNRYRQNQCFSWCFVTFCAQKVTKKARLSKNLTILTAPAAAQKKLALAFVQAYGPIDSLGSNSFLLHPPPWRQNGDFSKAIGHAAWHFVDVLHKR